MSQITQHQPTSARREVTFVMPDATAPETPKSGLTVTCTLLKPGGSSYGAISGSVAEVGSTGTYKCTLAIGDVDTVGRCLLKCDGGATALVQYVPFDVRAPEPLADIVLEGRKINTAASLAIHLFDQNGDLKTTPTLASGDFKVDVDGGGFANLATLPSEAPAGSGRVAISLSAAEMNGTLITVQWADQTAAKEWLPGRLIIRTRAVTVDELVRSTTPANTLDVASTGEAGLDFNNVKQATGSTTLANITVPAVNVVAQVNGLDNDAITADSIEDGAITGAKLADTAIQKIWDALTSALTTTGSIGKLAVDNLTAIANRIGSFAGSAENTIKGYLQALALSSATTPSELSGFDKTKHSAEKIGDQATGIGYTSGDKVIARLAGIKTDTGALNTDIYTADLNYTVDEAGSVDEFTIAWFKNGAWVLDGSIFTGVFIAVAPRSGSGGYGPVAMTSVGGGTMYKYDASGAERIAAGDAALVYVTGFLAAGGAATFAKVISRDSA